MTGAALLPPLLAGAFLLASAGLGKLRQPGSAALFLRSLGLPLPYLLVYSAALVELAVGGVVMFWPRVAAAAMAVLYLVFAAVVTVQLLRPTDVPCGCLGGDKGTSPRAHLGVNLICLLLSVAAFAAGPSSYWSLVLSSPFVALMTGLVAAVVALLAAAAVELFPETMGAWRGAKV